MRRKGKKWLKSYPSAGRLVKMDFPTIFCFPTWRCEMRRKVKKWLKSYPCAGTLLKMAFRPFSLLIYAGGR